VLPNYPRHWRPLNKLRVVLGLALFSVSWFAAAQSARFEHSLILGDGSRLVIVEGEREPRSTGSYTVRLYSGVNAQYPYDDFQAGVVLPRVGFIETIEVVSTHSPSAPTLGTVSARSPSDPTLGTEPAGSPGSVDMEPIGQCVAIVQRSAGTGGYLAGELLCADNGRLRLQAHVSQLPADADVVAHLRESM
jgi:hypothetical protein